MKYSEYRKIRNKIDTGTVFFTSGKSFYSRIIRFFTQSKVSHTGLFVWDIDEDDKRRLYIVEADSKKGITREYASNYFQHILSIGKIKKVKESETRNKAFELIGIPYDMKGALESLFKDTKTDDKLFCSEFVAKILDLDFPNLERGITPSDISSKVKKWLYVS